MLIRILVYLGFLLTPIPSFFLARYLYRPGVLLSTDYDPEGRSPFEMKSHPVKHFKSEYHKIAGVLLFFVPWMVVVALYIYAVTALLGW